MPPAPERILVISNGHGEDAIGAELVRRFPPNANVDAYPVIGSGGAYDGLCRLVGPRSHIPSQGWRHAKGSVMRDLGAMLASVPPAIGFLRSARAHYDAVIVVGDAAGLFLARFAGLSVAIYLDVFKTGYAHTYPSIEKWVIGKTSRVVFCRDDMLAQSLRAAGIDARTHGNVMIDTIPHGDYDIAARRGAGPSIAVLPGSRARTPDNLAVQVEALRAVPGIGHTDIFVAVADGIGPQDLARATGMVWHQPENASETDLGRLEGDGLVLNLVARAMGNVLEAADIVLAQAGTATQQAIGLGKPVIAFNDPSNRPKRMADEQALMGEGRILTEKSANAMAQAIRLLLENPAERERRGAIGRERMGGPGTLKAVLNELFG